MSSSAEEKLVEKSMDSFQVYKNRLKRNSLLAEEKRASQSGEAAGSTISPSKHEPSAEDKRSPDRVCTDSGQEAGPSTKGERDKPKTSFGQDADSLSTEKGSRKKSLGRRVANVLHFRKAGDTSENTVEESGPSLHVKFDQKPEVIE